MTTLIPVYTGGCSCGAHEEQDPPPQLHVTGFWVRTPAHELWCSIRRIFVGIPRVAETQQA